MSAGHGEKSSTEALRREVRKLLGDPKVKAYLSRPYRISYAHAMPLTGGSSVDGRTYYIDPHVDKADRQYVLWHERTEKAFRAVFGMHYLRAHQLATAAEHDMVGDRGWDSYKKRIGLTVRRDESERPKSMPKGFDFGPFRESGFKLAA